MNILGLNMYGHDSAAAIVKDGNLVAAVEEERLSRVKHDGSFPTRAAGYCLQEARLVIDDIDLIVLSKDFERLFKEKYLKYTLEAFPKANEIFLQSFDNIKYILNVENEIRKNLNYSGKIEKINHHICHFASSYYLSGFREAALVSIDALGEIETAAIGHGEENRIDILQSVKYPHSLGIMYSAITYYLGFTPLSSEGTVMALAALGDEKARFGNRTYIDIFRDIVKDLKDGKFEIDLEYFNYPFSRIGWVSKKFTDIFGDKRGEKDEISSHYKNIAAALQKRFEEIYLHVINHAHKITGSKRLALGGGCALNCVANRKILTDTPFEDLYIQPAATDSGTAIGAALYANYLYDRKAGTRERSKDTYLGPSFSNGEIKDTLDRLNINAKFLENAPLVAADLLKEGKVIGWFQGRMEFGPRALGNRSILAKAYPIEVKDRINREIKHRLPFRPFAPSILKECVNDYFDATSESPFMLLAFKANEKNRDKVAAILHVDYTGRVHSVEKEVNKKYHMLLAYFYEMTKIPLVLNTSFNDSGEPMVCTPEDAVKTFKSANLDALIIGDFLIER